MSEPNLPAYDPTTSPYRMAGSLEDRYKHPSYLVKKQMMKLVGSAVRIFGPNEQLVFYVERKAFKIKDDIRVYADETKTTELFRIGARQMFDFFGTFDVFDSATGQIVGSLQRRNLVSAFRDEWSVLDQTGTQIGRVIEDSLALALVRRFLIKIIPQSYDLEHNGQKVADFKQHFGLFGYKMDLVFTEASSNNFDHRMGIAAAVMMALIEGRQR